MAHPQMFDDADPLLAKLRTLALAFPGAAEKVSHGRPAFFTKKVFAYYGASVRVDGVWKEHPNSLIFDSDPDERDGLLADSRFFVPAYLGAYGWVGLDLQPTVKKNDWTEVRELLDASYRVTAPAKLVKQLDL